MGIEPSKRTGSNSYRAPAVDSDSSESSKKSNKSKSSVPSGQGRPSCKPASPAKPNKSDTSDKTNKTNRSQDDKQNKSQTQTDQQAQDEARRQQEQQQQQQQQQQSQPQSPPNLQNLNLNQDPNDIEDIVAVDMIFLRLRPETNTIDEHLLELPRDSIIRLHESRIERFDFSRRGNPAHRDIGILQTLSKMKGLPVCPGYKKVPGAEAGVNNMEPPEGGLDTLRELLIAQLRRVQDQERWEPKPIHIKCYLRYFREGDAPDAASKRLEAEIVRQLRKGGGDFEDVSDQSRVWERWVSDGPPGKIVNFRKFGYRDEGEHLECLAPGKWETMYWIEGGLRQDSRFNKEVRGRKTEADGPRWKGLVSKRAVSPVLYEGPVGTGRGREKKKPPRDSGVGMGEDEEREQEREEEARKEKARQETEWKRQQEENASNRRKRRKDAAAATTQSQNETTGSYEGDLKRALETSPKDQTPVVNNGFGNDGADEGRPGEIVGGGPGQQQPDEEDLEMAALLSPEEYLKHWGNKYETGQRETGTEAAAAQQGNEKLDREKQQMLEYEREVEEGNRKIAEEQARLKKLHKDKRSAPREEDDEIGKGRETKKPKLGDEDRPSERRKETEKTEPKVLTAIEIKVAAARKQLEEDNRIMEQQHKIPELPHEDKDRLAKKAEADRKAWAKVGDLDDWVGSEGSGDGEQMSE